MFFSLLHKVGRRNKLVFFLLHAISGIVLMASCQMTPAAEQIEQMPAIKRYKIWTSNQLTIITTWEGKKPNQMVESKKIDLKNKEESFYDAELFRGNRCDHFYRSLKLRWFVFFLSTFSRAKQRRKNWLQFLVQG